ncbi:hypothetical protein Droror1_Dr00006258 [Drosera rotundifolia]
MSTLPPLPNRIPPSARCTSASAAVATAVSTIGDDYSRFKQSGILGFESRCLHQRHYQIASLRPLAARPSPSSSPGQFPPSATITLDLNSLEFCGSNPDVYTDATPKLHPFVRSLHSASAVVATTVSTIGDDYSRFQQSGISGFESRYD